MRFLLLIVSLSFFSFCANAQTTMPMDPVSGKVTYRFSVPTDKKTDAAAAFSLVQDWFEKNPCEFKRCNINPYSCLNQQSVNVKNQAEVEKVFGNPSPLQSLDPESNRLTGKVVARYAGDGLGILKVVYLEYFMIVKVSDASIDCEITDIRYNHFNPKSYNLQRINNWSDFSSLEPVSTVEYLQENQKCAGEFCKFAEFMNQDMEKLFASLGNHIKTSKALTLNTR